MTNSLKVRIQFHICHKAIVYYEGSKFSTFDLFCNYINYFVGNKYYIQNLPQHVKKILFIIVDDVNKIFGISKKEMLEIVIGFFTEKLWVEYEPLVIPLKTMYDSALNFLFLNKYNK